MSRNINKRPVVALGSLAACLLLAAWFATSKMRQAEPRLPVTHNQVFFTTDDGATLFADNVLRMPPFDHDGSQAVRAYVFKAGGPQWVQYLMKYSDAGMRHYDLLQSSVPGTVAPLAPSEMLVKRPGAGGWVAFTAAEAAKITKPNDPSGGSTGTIDPVNP